MNSYPLALFKEYVCSNFALTLRCSVDNFLSWEEGRELFHILFLGPSGSYTLFKQARFRKSVLIQGNVSFSIAPQAKLLFLVLDILYN